jgi:hypothetical protein
MFDRVPLASHQGIGEEQSDGLGLERPVRPSGERRAVGDVEHGHGSDRCGPRQIVSPVRSLLASGEFGRHHGDDPTLIDRVVA